MNYKTMIITLVALTMLIGCGEKEKKTSLTEGGMKCGAGKCGASMVDGSAILIKKKMNIINQLREDDDRRQCVLDSTTTKELYNCVREEKTARLSTKCSANNVKDKEKETMKCESGKCGS